MSRDIGKARTLIRVRVSCFSVLRAWLGDDEFGATDDAVDGRSGDGDLVVVLKVPELSKVSTEPPAIAPTLAKVSVASEGPALLRVMVLAPQVEVSAPKVCADVAVPLPL